MPATLAVLGVDGRLASGVTVEIGGDRVTTDETGRGYFTAPSTGQVLLAKASGSSAAALIDRVAPGGVQQAISVAPLCLCVSLFRSVGPGFEETRRRPM